jgi:hypothetical protein
MGKPELVVSEDFEYLCSFLPLGWQSKAKELGALRRCRKVRDAVTLLRVLLLHLAEGCSLRETAMRARQGKLLELSDVAIMDRLRMSEQWFRWMNTEIMRAWVQHQPESIFGSRWTIRLIDATRVTEPGPTGSLWCIHYSVRLPSLYCDELSVCDQQGNGESFTRFAVSAGDLLIGDRAYGLRPGIFHVVDAGGDVLVRFALSNLPLQNPKGTRFDLLKRLRGLRGTKLGEWPVRLEWKGRWVDGRVCALKKSRQAAEKAQREALRAAKKKGHEIKPSTLEAAAYTFVFTTVPYKYLATGKVLEMYRGRWQIELVFKRLKSIMALGHLRKRDEQASRAWLQGKLLVAFLVEVLLRHGESFFPWGYPIRQAGEQKSLSVARRELHVLPAATGG